MAVAILAGLGMFLFCLLAIASVAGVVVWMDARAARGWTLSEGAAVGSPLRVAPSPSVPDEREAKSLCEGCGKLHPPEALPLELLLGAGLEVNVGRWMGRPA